jgi:hypothetical protein
LQLNCEGGDFSLAAILIDRSRRDIPVALDFILKSVAHYQDSRQAKITASLVLVIVIR